MWDRILNHPRGDRAFVELLMLAGEAGSDALAVACELTPEGGVASAPVVMNELCRLIAPQSLGVINVPDGIALRIELMANCQQYDYLGSESCSLNTRLQLPPTIHSHRTHDPVCV